VISFGVVRGATLEASASVGDQEPVLYHANYTPPPSETAREIRIYAPFTDAARNTCRENCMGRCRSTTARGLSVTENLRLRQHSVPLS